MIFDIVVQAEKLKLIDRIKGALAFAYSDKNFRGNFFSLFNILLQELYSYTGYDFSAYLHSLEVKKWQQD